MLTVEQARKERRCRICGEEVEFPPSPVGWETEFRELVYPIRFTLNFGTEFSHTDCITDT